MKKFVLLWLVLLLAACGAAEAPQTTTENATEEPAQEATAVVTAEQPTAEQPADEAPANTSDSGSFKIATTPEEAGLARNRDWSKGATEPAVTIVEYGDFQ